jgi:multicomponent Na+:H+ antiporter subunit C
MTYLPYAVAVWLFVVGLYGVVASRNLIHLAVSLSVAQSSTYVLLLAVGYRNKATAPIFIGPSPHPAVDPVVQALALTDIVVSVTVLGLILALAVDVHQKKRTLDPDALADLTG